MRKPSVNPEIFRERRARLAKKMAASSALVVPAHPEFLRNHDVHFDYRQDTNLFYLTGFEEPESVLVFRPGQESETILFVREKDPLRETWDGFRYGPLAAQTEFMVDKTYPISALDQVLPDLLKTAEKIYYRLRQNTEFDRKLTQAMETVKTGRGRSGRGLQTIEDSTELVGEMRIIKSEIEAEWLQKAGDLSSLGHINAMKFTRPGVTERQVQGILEATFKLNDSPRLGYNSIVATGANATTLHYVYNDQTCKSGDLLLIDAGTEWNQMTGDITRTFPVSGKFSPIQKEIYEAVLTIQKSLVEMVAPGVLHRDLQVTAIDKLTALMIDFKLLKGKKEDLITNSAFKKYYPHGVSHYLGGDVHDAGLYQISGEPRKLEAGICLTIEPGIYIRADDMDAPKDLRGIGIRIEDDILVTSTGRRNLTVAAPKEVAEMEKIIGTGVQF